MSCHYDQKEYKPATGVHSAGSSKPSQGSSGGKKKSDQKLSKKTKAKNRRRGVQKAIKTKAKNKRRLERDREQAEVVRQVNPDYEGPFERKARVRKEYLAKRRERLRAVDQKYEATVAKEHKRIRRRNERIAAERRLQVEERITNGHAGPSSHSQRVGQTASNPIEIVMDEEEERVEHGPRPPSNPQIMTPYVPLMTGLPSSASPAGLSNAVTALPHNQSTAGTAGSSSQHYNGSQMQTSASQPNQAKAGPSTPRVHYVNYPKGGVTSQKKKKGIFADPEKDKKLRVWVDPMLRGRVSMIQKIKGEHGRISADHTEKETQLIILSPRSTYLFDMYCHPDWLCHEDLLRFSRKRPKLSKSGEEEPWQRKVLLKEMWISRCLEAGRFLGEADDWGGCRAGGPPVGVLTTTEAPGGAEVNEDQEGEEDDYWTDDDEETEDEDEEMPLDEEYPGEDEEADEDEGPPDQPSEQQPDKSEHLQTQWPVLKDVQEMLTVEAPDIPKKSTRDVDSPSVHPRDSVPPVPPSPHISILDGAAGRKITGLQTPDTSLTPPPSFQPENGSKAAQAMSASGQNQDPPAADDAPWAMETEDDDTGHPIQDIADEDAVMEEVDPKTMFQGFKFWLDPACPDRLPLIRRLRGAGAELSTDYTESTHVLIHGYKANLWHGIVTNLASLGIWFVTVSWVIKSLDAGLKLPEESYVVPGGNAKIAAGEKDKKPELLLPGSSGSYEARMSTEDIAAIFERESKMLEHGGTVKALSAFLVSKYGTYSEVYWQNLYHQWLKGEERFARMKAALRQRRTSTDESTESGSSIISSTPVSITTNKLSTEVVRQAIESAVEKNPQMAKPALCRLLHEEHPEYTAGDWSRNIGYWMNRSGRFSGLPPHSASTLSATILEAPKSLAAQTAVSAPPETKKGPAYSTEEIHRIFSEEVSVIMAYGVTSYTEIGKRLANKYPGLHSTTWSITYSEWVRKTGRFLPSAQTASSTSKSGKEFRSTEDLCRIFKQHEPYFVSGGMDATAIGYSLEEQFGDYSASSWATLWRDWTRLRKRFARIDRASMPTLAYEHRQQPGASGQSGSQTTSTPASSAVTAVTETPKGGWLRLHAEDIAKIFKERESLLLNGATSRFKIGNDLAAEIGVYTSGSWQNYVGDWLRGMGRFSGLEPALRSVQAGGIPSSPSSSNHHTNAAQGLQSKVISDSVAPSSTDSRALPSSTTTQPAPAMDSKTTSSGPVM
ncbi:hypothetical protein I316_04634 [Kwoniella heveanensis BCC8398]|uniref:BRCT domain-containing protein n=1 Tax=Kwoniella heveanensis BCC8398 TaxID=1296120 RepID=A0A1B9GR70_9TREE|nr:hypothetical protein I316_04634 [Kwoniella heveanensis BCC8398]